ncbi:MAG: TAXI family TRAP transporter solute-binding subunit [Lautropia sp.]
MPLRSPATALSSSSRAGSGKRRLRGALLSLAAIAIAAFAAPASAIDYKIVTASERGTYIQIGKDLGRLVAPAADIRLDALPSAGSAENVRRLRFEPGVKFALVQSDVYQAFLDQAAGGNQDARGLITPLRVILPLYNEEIYFVARRDAPFDYVHQIEGQRIGAGPLGSGTALTTTTLYRQMFGKQLPQDRTAYLSNEEALSKLVTDKSVDVVVIVAGQPAKVLADMKPEARELIKLLAFDPDADAGKAALQTYFNASVKASSYPNLLDGDLPSLAVKAFLVTYNYTQPATLETMTRFGESLCRNFGALQRDGHPKWKEVELSLPPLGRGWKYFGATSRPIAQCGQSAATGGAGPGPRSRPATCSQQERVLGLCR